MYLPSSIRFVACIALFALVSSASGLDFTEDFEGWTDDGSYAGIATYASTNGMWASFDALAAPQSGLSNMVRFWHESSGAPWLEYRGLDGNGIDGGVGTVSFDYRHWDGDGKVVAFQLQYSINGGAWLNTGPEVSVSGDTVVREYSHALNLPDDNIKLRVLSTANDERLLIDDFSVTDASAEPLIRFEPTSATVDETDGSTQLTVTIAPAVAATVEVARIAGDAAEGSDYTISPTTLVFSAGTATATITLTDDMDPENTETAVWTLQNAVGGAMDPPASMFTLTIIDDDNVTVAFANAAGSAGEAAGSIDIPVVLSRAADAYVELQLSGTAEPITDYTLSTTALVFTAAGPTSQVVTVHIQEDGVTESAETLTLTLAASVGAGVGAPPAHTLTLIDNDVGDDTITILAANLTSGNSQSYPDPGPGTRIMQALQPDIIAIQEFNVPGTLRSFVDNTFGTNFHFMLEPDPDNDDQIPNGIISRWPIIASGEWDDPQLTNREFAWATIDIPGETHLHVISVHLHSSGGASSRNIEAQEIISQVQANLPANDYIVLAGDFNTGSRTESTVTTLKTVFFDTHQPEDQFGDDDTNARRSNPYDWVMPNAALNNLHTSLTVGGIAFPDGIVMDTRVWGGSPPSPALAGDSGASMMQHMGVMKAFAIPSTSQPQFAALGTPHAWLIANGFTNNFDAAELLDTDLDGMLAWQEYIAGTIPTDDASLFAVTEADLGTSVAVTFDTQPGRRYTIEYADNFASSPISPQWDPFASPAAGIFDENSPAPGSHAFIDDFGPSTTTAEPTSGTRVYRVRVSLP